MMGHLVSIMPMHCLVRVTGWATLLVSLGQLAAAQTFLDTATRIPVGPNPSAIVAADLSGDGRPEIVTADRGTLTDPREERPANDELSFLVALEDGSYQTQPPLRAGFAPYSVAVANIDALKAPDLLVASFQAARDRDITVFRNLGGNLFEPYYYSVPDGPLEYMRMRDGDDAPLFTTPGITSLVVHDIDHDRLRDVIATGWASDVLVIFPGTVDTFLGTPKFIRAPGGPRDIGAADFDGDNEVDLVTTMYSTAEVALWKGDGRGRFKEVTRFASRGSLPHRVQVSDINGDGRLDLAISHCHSDDSIVLFYGDGGFAFSTSQEIALGEDRRVLGREIRDIVVEDLTGDGRRDLAAACYASRQVIVLINRSKGPALPQSFEQEMYTFEDGRPRALAVADFNQDGRSDLGVALWEANAVGFLLGRSDQ